MTLVTLAGLRFSSAPLFVDYLSRGRLHKHGRRRRYLNRCLGIRRGRFCWLGIRGWRFCGPGVCRRHFHCLGIPNPLPGILAVHGLTICGLAVHGLTVRRLRRPRVPAHSRSQFTVSSNRSHRYGNIGLLPQRRGRGMDQQDCK